MTLHRLPPRLTVVDNDNPWTDPHSYEPEPPEPSTFDKVSDALGSRDCLLVYIGAYFGCMVTAVAALIWSKVL